MRRKITIFALLFIVVCFPIMAHASGRDYLDAEEKIIYDALYGQITEIVSGKSSVTKFCFSFIENEDRIIDPAEETEVLMSGCMIGFDAQKLGLDTLFLPSVSGKKYVSAAAKSALEKKIDAMSKRLLFALIQDCPMELFWFNKSDGLQMNYQYVQSVYAGKDQLILSEITCSLAVNQEYADDYAYRTDLTKIGKADRAIAEAKSIVSSAEGKNDKDKLMYYRDCILKLADYNHTPENSGNTYEIIWLFDRDPETKVVCEAYAKAFQYLCDLSEFSNVKCRTIYGEVKIPEENGSGYARYTHAWNLVQLDGKNYLVDLTNCDAGTIGEPDLLYLACYSSGSVKDGYEVTVPKNGDVTYYYTTEARDFYGAGELSLTQHIHENVKAVENDKTGGTESYYLIEYCKTCLKEFSRTKMTDSTPPEGYEYEDELDYEDLEEELSQEEWEALYGEEEYEEEEQELYVSSAHWISDALPMRKQQKITAVMISDLPEGDFVESYSSSDTKIVKVSGKANGEVRLKAGKKKGNACISAVLHSGMTLEMKISVSSKAVKTKKIDVEIPAEQPLLAGQKIRIITKLSPVTSTQKVTFRVKKKSILTVDKKGILTAKKAGTTELWVKSGAVKKKITVKVTR